MFVFLLLAALSSFAGKAVAQPQEQQFVVVYVEFKPADTKAGGEVLEELASQALASAGVIRFDVLQQVDRPNFFALFEIWSSAQTFAAFQSSSATQAILTQLAPLLEAPLDEWGALRDLRRLRVEVFPIRRRDFEDERHVLGELAEAVSREGHIVYGG